MHFEILVEDQSGKKALDILVPKIIDPDKHTFRVIAYKGVGHVPGKMKNAREAHNRGLLNNLSRLLQGYGNTFTGPAYDQNIVMVVLDLDDECQKERRQQLLGMLKKCNPKPQTQFCIAIEEGEAWLLGDQAACKKAFPKAKTKAFQSYKNDSICGTWEVLAEAVYPGGRSALLEQGWSAVGAEKAMWADKIAPHIDVDRNASPSFQYFRNKMRGFTIAGSLK